MSATSSNYSVLVNTSDGFEDCWPPFFTLLDKYWPQCKAPIYLNTETKNWNWPGKEVICCKVQGANISRLTWSECLIAALEQIKTPFVLYFQEDYFIHQQVNDDVIENAAKFMMDHPEVKHIALTRHGSLGPYETYSVEPYQLIRQDARYRISTQAALWRVDTLKSYLRSEENGWMFEIYGTWRARRVKETFLSLKFDNEHGGPAIDYLHTGIIKGRWLNEIKQVFDQNGIEMDFSKRGYYEPKPPLIHKFELLGKLLKRPVYMARQFFSF